MKKLTKAAVLAIGAAMAAHGAYAGSAGDLILGINNNDNGGVNDYILDLGNLTSLTAGSTVTTGTSVSSIETALGGTSPTGYNLGIVAGYKSAGLGSGTTYAFTSQLDNGTGTPTVAGSTFTLNNSTANIVGAAGDGKTMATGATGSIAVTSANSFTSVIAKNPTTAGTGAGNFVSNLGGGNPLSTLGSSDVITLDLYKNLISGTSGQNGNPGGWVYEGDIQIDLSGTDLAYTYDPATSAVPEPSTYGMLAGGGLLALAFRRQLSRKTA